MLFYTRKLYYEHFTPDFRLHNNLWEINNTNSTGDFELKDKNKSNSELVWQIQLISIKG